METGLAIVSTINAVEFFQPNASAGILEHLEVSVREEASKLDISTNAGRKAIASLAAKVAQSKTGLEAAGKELVAGEKARLKLIDIERSKVWDRLEALQKEVRKPLTDWEEADKKRCAALEFKVVTVQGLATLPINASTEQIESRITELDSIDLTNMQEFTSRSEVAYKTTLQTLTAALEASKQRDAERKELARLKAEEEARHQREREERIAQEAREKAQREAEIERQYIEQEKFEAEARAKQAEAERIAAQERAAREVEEAIERHKREVAGAAKRHEEELERARLKALADAEEAKRKREEDQRRHEEEVRAAAAKAEKDRLAAIEAERQRAEAAKRKEQEEADARERNRKHAAKINSEVAHALALNCYITEETAKLVVTAIAKGLIPHTRISY